MGGSRGGRGAIFDYPAASGSSIHRSVGGRIGRVSLVVSIHAITV